MVIGDLNPDAQETVEMLKVAGREGLFVRADVSDTASVESLMQRAVDTYGGLHCDFNNAGVLPPTRHWRSRTRRISTRPSRSIFAACASASNTRSAISRVQAAAPS